MQRLGLAYHFEDEIKVIITWFYEDERTSNDLYLTAQRYRVLREHGFPVSSDVFDRFRGQDGRFSESLGSDLEGLLGSYEASHLGMPDEDVLDEARSFTTKKLKHCLFEGMESYLADQVRQSLEIPLYWKLQRVEAWNFIGLPIQYYRKSDFARGSQVGLQVSAISISARAQGTGKVV